MINKKKKKMIEKTEESPKEIALYHTEKPENDENVNSNIYQNINLQSWPLN